MNKDSSNYRALSVFMDHIEDFGVYRLVFDIDLGHRRSLVRLGEIQSFLRFHGNWVVSIGDGP